MIRPVAAKTSKRVKVRKNKKTKQRGGGIYTFDLDPKNVIGGLPPYKALNGTQDGDCPSSGALDLGFTNYGLKKGGSYKKNKNKNKNNNKNKKYNKKSHKSNNSKNSKKHKSSKNTKKNNNSNSNKYKK